MAWAGGLGFGGMGYRVFGGCLSGWRSSQSGWSYLRGGHPLQVSHSDGGSGSGNLRESRRGTISFVDGYRDWEDLVWEEFGRRREMGFGRALVGAVTFFQPCGVGRLSQILCAVISHTRKRGRFWG